MRDALNELCDVAQGLVTGVASIYGRTGAVVAHDSALPKRVPPFPPWIEALREMLDEELITRDDYEQLLGRGP